jgi:hypothetical protein
MRIVSWSALPAVVRVKTRGDVMIAIPRHMSRDDVLDLARCVLTSSEYQELVRSIGQPHYPHKRP